MGGTTVIADDLTGAADCGIAYCLAGLSTFVSLGRGAPPPGVDVVSVDTDTRHERPAVAAERTFAAAAAAYRAGTDSVYKKIDSTLRGNVGVELAAAYRAAQQLAGTDALVIAAPAFPGTGRTTREGRVFVRGVPLEETDVWHGSGMKGPADLSGILGEAGLAVTRIGLDVIRLGARSVRDRVREVTKGGVNTVVCDAEQEDDLRLVAEGGSALARPVVWCGSGGLARHLAAGMARPATRPMALPERPGSVLVLVGSRSEVAREQARVLAARPGIESLTVSAETLLAPGGPAWNAAAGALRGAMEAGHDVVVVTGLEHLLALESGLAVASGLARLATADIGAVRGIVATGGDVARSVMTALGAGGLHLVGEVEPGVPLGVTDTDPPLAIVTKAGAFGDGGTLERSRDALRALGGARGD